MTLHSPTYAYLAQRSYNGCMEPDYDSLRLHVALLSNERGIPTDERLAELAHHLNDEHHRAPLPG